MHQNPQKIVDICNITRAFNIIKKIQPWLQKNSLVFNYNDRNTKRQEMIWLQLWAVADCIFTNRLVRHLRSGSLFNTIFWNAPIFFLYL